MFIPVWTVTLFIALFIIWVVIMTILIYVHHTLKDYVFEKTQHFDREQTKYAAELTLHKSANGKLCEIIEARETTIAQLDQRVKGLDSYGNMMSEMYEAVTLERDSLIAIAMPYAEHYGESFGNIEKPIEEVMDKVRQVFGGCQTLVTVAMMAYGERRGEITTAETPIFADMRSFDASNFRKAKS